MTIKKTLGLLVYGLRHSTERAIECRRRIAVFGALRSTFAPTTALLRELALQQQYSLDMVEVFCEGAFRLFEAGDRAGYVKEIARCIEANALTSDVVVLAQASMAPAAELVAHLGIPVLSSPRLGVAAALSIYRSLPAGPRA